MMTETITKIVNSRYDLVRNALVYAGRSILMLCCVYSSTGIVASGFGFNTDFINLFLLLFLLSFSVTAAVTIFRWRGFFSVLLLFLFFTIRNFALIREQFMFFIYTLSERYNAGLPIPIMFINTTHVDDSTYFFTFAGTTMIILLAVTICLKPATALTILATLPFALLSFILVETIPGTGYLVCLLVSYLTMLLSNSIIIPDAKKKALWILPAFIPAVILCGILYIAAPPAGYIRSAYIENIRVSVNYFAEQIALSLSAGMSAPNGINNGWFSADTADVWSFNTKKVDIFEAGERVIANKDLIDIISSQAGTLYIRGFTLDRFDGKSWYPADDPSGVLYAANTISDNSPEVVAMHYINNAAENEELDILAPIGAGISFIRISDYTNVDYIPYHKINAVHEADFIESYEYLIDFDSKFYYIPGNIRNYITDDFYNPALDTIVTNTFYYSRFFDVYTQVDSNTASYLRQLAIDAGISLSSERAQTVDAVAAFVRNSAVYTLNPPETPEGEDFVVYFLETSQAGYCIHYATTAALMLRSLDIPARFASGYVTTINQRNVGSPVTLTDRNAHAWVEVFYDDAGWLPLEVTPSSNASGVPQPRPHVPVSRVPVTTPSPTPGSNETGQNSDYTSPRPGSGQRPGTASENHALPQWVITFFAISACIICLILLLAVRRLYIISNRRKTFMEKNANVALLSMWKYANKLYGRQGLIPSDIEELVLKARFSRHKITEEERNTVITYVHRLALETYEDKNDYTRLWFKYIRCLY